MDVAVLICTYGGEEWPLLARERAYPSAYAQGRPDRTVYLFHSSAETISKARNHAVSSLAGDAEWLCFLDADDELAPGYLDAMEAAWWKLTSGGGEVATESGPRPTWHGELVEPSLLVPAVEYLDGRGLPKGEPGIPSWGRPIQEVNCAVIGTLIPRALFERVGGFPEEPIYEDWALWLACVRAGAELVPVHDAVYRAWARPGSRNAGGTAEATEVYWRRRREHEAWLA